MAVQALTSAIDLFSAQAADQLWPAPDLAVRELQDELKVHISRLSDLVRKRKIDAVQQKRDLNASFKSLAAEGHESLKKGLLQLGETISRFESIIEQNKTTLALQQAEMDASLARIASVSASTAGLARRSINKLVELGSELHNETVEFYYFLLALRAEYTPDARGGPSFDDPKALGDYLREQMKA
jgi:hypothetical protein